MIISFNKRKVSLRYLYESMKSGWNLTTIKYDNNRKPYQPSTIRFRITSSLYCQNTTMRINRDPFWRFTWKGGSHLATGVIVVKVNYGCNDFRFTLQNCNILAGHNVQFPCVSFPVRSRSWSVRSWLCVDPKPFGAASAAEHLWWNPTARDSLRKMDRGAVLNSGG